jgi:uncharacterized protein DUF1579
MTKLLSLILLFLVPSNAFGQEQSAQSPQPGPEVQKLAYYVGTWKGEGESKASPFGSGGKLSSSQTCEWFDGRFQVMCRGEETGPSGKRKFLNIIAYDQEKRAYTEYSISSFGESEYDKDGSYVGDKLTFLMDVDAGGKPAKLRYTEVHLSANLYTYQAEASLGGGTWTTIGEGKITKVK